MSAARRAGHHVLLEASTILRSERAFEVLGHELDELFAGE